MTENETEDADSRSELSWPSLMAPLADCIDALGGEDFESTLLSLLRAALDIEQCMIFALDHADQLRCLLAANDRQPRLAQRLATLYAEGLFREDPNYPTLKRLAMDGSDGATLASMQGDEMSPAYRRHLFAFPELVDKVSLAVPVEGGVTYLNLYRGREGGKFTCDELAALERLRPTLAALTRRHYGLARPTRLTPGPQERRVLAPLSQRERALCLYLLRGYSIKSAARELEVAPSTAETYRKRAYAKLGVGSKAALIRLCQN